MGNDLVFVCPGQRALETRTRLRELAVDVRHGIMEVGRGHGRERVDLDVLAAALKVSAASSRRLAPGSRRLARDRPRTGPTWSSAASLIARRKGAGRSRRAKHKRESAADTVAAANTTRPATGASSHPINTEAPITTAAASVKRKAPASDPNGTRLMSLTLRRRNRKSSRRAYRAIRIPYGGRAQEPAATPRNHSGRRRRPFRHGRCRRVPRRPGVTKREDLPDRSRPWSAPSMIPNAGRRIVPEPIDRFRVRDRPHRQLLCSEYRRVQVVRRACQCERVYLRRSLTSSPRPRPP